MTNAREQPPINARLQEFIEKERNRFAIEHNNTFALGFSDITIYRGFLEVIALRHRQASQGLHTNTQAMVASVERRKTKRFHHIFRAKVFLMTTWSSMSGRARKRPNPNSLTVREHGFLSDAQVWTAMVRLESESWYLFAKILLDEVARGIEFYFGPVQRQSLDSHDDLVRCLDAYSESKGLAVPADLMDRAESLKAQVSDYRDYQVAHHKSPRTMRGTTFSHEKPDSARIVHLQWYPRKGDRQVESRDFSELTVLIDDYLRLALDFFEHNRDKCRLERAQ